MLICLDSTLISGYLSNEIPGLVTGTLNLAGQAQPLRIELTGNFLRDIAGCRLELQNPVPNADLQQTTALAASQMGYVGQMTASHRVTHMPRSRRSAGGLFAVPQGLKNLLFLEWFNRERQRVLLQSWHIHLTVSAPRWQLSRQAEAAQVRQNRARRKQFLLGEDSRPSLGAAAADVFDGDAGFNPFDSATSDVGAMLENDSAGTTESPSPDGAAASAMVNQVCGDLVLELRRFELLLASPGQLQSRPAVLRLFSTAGDLAAHLSHTLKNFAHLKSSQWKFLITDLEQSLPLFHTALSATDKLVDQAPPGSDLRWLLNLQKNLCSTSGCIEQLLKWLMG